MNWNLHHVTIEMQRNKKRKWQNPCHSSNTTFCTPSQQSIGTRHPAAVVVKPHLPFWVRTSWPVCRSPKISRFCDILHTLKNPKPDCLLPGNKQGTSSSWYEATSYLVYGEEQATWSSLRPVGTDSSLFAFFPLLSQEVLTLNLTPSPLSRVTRQETLTLILTRALLPYLNGSFTIINCFGKCPIFWFLQEKKKKKA